MKCVKSILKAVERFILGFKQKKDVLIVVHNRIMYSYALPVYEALKHDKRLRVWFCYPWTHLMTQGDFEKIQNECRPRVVSYRIAKYIKWDLIIFPDHQPYFRKSVTKIYIGHGLEAGKKVGDEHYVFSARSRHNNEWIYQKIFVSSEFFREKVKIHYPDFLPLIRVTGNFLLDEMKKMTHKEDGVLEGTIFDKKKKTVMIVSSWGPHSLIQTQCEALLGKLEVLARDYNLILSIHLNNYNPKHSPQFCFDEIFNKLVVKNVHVIKRGESPIKWLGAADLLITDFTSTSLYFTVLGRPVIYYDNPALDFDAVSLILELRKITLNISDLSVIEQDIPKAFRDFNPEKMRELASKIDGSLGTALERYKYEIYESLGMN
ncbi:MAG: hypothetical protein A2Y04_04695 [Omnitrophica WOR_2 bacterium GWC2_45_7]|nr:MAG: hypothetical protein A2Z81_08795 [Omnitrophica WOR_2 bacterium GWA2_45_18]OGX18981.1 MAG: hypothetical protein A2Y04_04695 [Omnitrophica WOR_2 bacterium GWC2_45_7]